LNLFSVLQNITSFVFFACLFTACFADPVWCPDVESLPSQRMEFLVNQTQYFDGQGWFSSHAHLWIDTSLFVDRIDTYMGQFVQQSSVTHWGKNSCGGIEYTTVIDSFGTPPVCTYGYISDEICQGDFFQPPYGQTCISDNTTIPGYWPYSGYMYTWRSVNFHTIIEYSGYFLTEHNYPPKLIPVEVKYTQPPNPPAYNQAKFVQWLIPFDNSIFDVPAACKQTKPTSNVIPRSYKDYYSKQSMK